jgi:cob(I)alamin adenosyltransferase
MEVDTAHLHAGADRCRDAAGTALAAAGKLAEKKPAVGMFGDFDEAHAFHQAISAAHQDHIERLHGHHRALTDVGDKSRSAAHEFTARDASTADSLRAAEAGFSTL